MGSVSHSTSDELHREADAASSPKPDLADVANPRRTLARREEAAGLSPAPATPSTTSSGGMSQSDFGRGGSKRTGPPADLLKRHQSK